MSLTQQILLMAALVVVAGFLSLAEIALAGARKIKLKLMAESGETRALKVIALQEQSADFFAANQIYINAISILAGILGESQLRPYLVEAIGWVYQGRHQEDLGFMLAFLLVTSLFVLFSDLMPKRLAMTAPEKFAVSVIGPLEWLIKLCKPFAFLFNWAANRLFKLFRINTAREEKLTFDDISAVFAAGAQSGVLQEQEYHFIENVFELESRNVTSSMTLRDNVIFFDLKESEDSIRQKIADNPYSKFLVCDQVIDRVIGYVDTKDILVRLLTKQSWQHLNESSIRSALTIPDTLSLSELLDRFRSTKENLAVVINEYALVVGIVTMSDIMSTVMGRWVAPESEDSQILPRDEASWLIEGSTPISSLKSVLGISELPEEEHYETAAGFIMFSLRKIPKPTDFVSYGGFKFEVVDVDHYRIDQLLVTRLPDASEPTPILPAELA